MPTCREAAGVELAHGRCAVPLDLAGDEPDVGALEADRFHIVSYRRTAAPRGLAVGMALVRPPMTITVRCRSASSTGAGLCGSRRPWRHDAERRESPGDPEHGQEAAQLVSATLAQVWLHIPTIDSVARMLMTVTSGGAP